MGRIVSGIDTTPTEYLLFRGHVRELHEAAELATMTGDPKDWRTVARLAGRAQRAAREIAENRENESHDFTDAVHRYLRGFDKPVQTEVIVHWYGPNGAGDHSRGEVVAALNRLKEVGLARLTPEGWEVA